MLSRFSVVVRSVGVIIGIIGFVLLVGDDPPVVRAGITGVLGYLAFASGTRLRLIALTIAVAAIMVARNPGILVSDVSFQLSFLSVFGLIVLKSALERFFQRIPTILSARESVVLTLSATAFCVPLVAVVFGEVSTVFLLSNLLVAPLIPAIMLFSALSLVFVGVFAPAAIALGFIADSLSRIILLVANGLSAPEWAVVSANF